MNKIRRDVCRIELRKGHVRLALVVLLLPKGWSLTNERAKEEMKPLTADEFERAYAERSGVTVEWLRGHGQVVLPCRCGGEDCEGWQMLSAEQAADPRTRRMAGLDA